MEWAFASFSLTALSLRPSMAADFIWVVSFNVAKRRMKWRRLIAKVRFGTRVSELGHGWEQPLQC
jgi:hypothetical protein